jgi:hypothetical protein
MPIQVVVADINKDIDTFVELLNRNREQRVDRKRFEWLYWDNPRGKAKAWLVIDEKSQQAVAFTVVLPRLFRINGQEKTCWNCGDFSVDKKYRTLGVALKLRRQAKEGVANGESAALYAHPNDRMKVIHEKVGHAPIGFMQRYVKLLRIDKHLERVVKNRGLSRIIAPIGNLGLKMFDASARLEKQYTIEILGNTEFDQEYDKLFEEASRHYKVIGDRTAAFLNWRFIDCPLYKTERIIIRRDGKLAGFIIFSEDDKIAVFKDMLCLPDEKIINTLLSQWVQHLRQRKLRSISAILMNGNPLLSILQKHGFRPRPEVSSIFGYTTDKDLGNLWLHGTNWYMTVGDRDV